MKIGKIGVAVISLVPFNVYAECTPTPDCASIGYTETSCEGDSLKCPFDTSKLKCMPCDSSFKYTCEGDNITGAIGITCGGKYVSCECFVGGKFNNGMCVCDTACTVGAIYYSDGSCSTCVIPSKTAIGIVVKDNELLMTQKLTSVTWSSSYTGVAGITETTNSTNAKQDFNGKSNTLAIVETFTNDTIDNNAAIYCNSYSTDGTNVGDWYLPAVGELYSYVYGNYSKINIAMTKLNWVFGSYIFWSSSERDGGSAWNINPSNGGMLYGYGGKLGNYPVTCFLSIN